VAAHDLAFLDGTFYDVGELPGRDMSEVPHPLVVDTLRRLRGLRRGEGTPRIVLVHLNHTNPLWAENSPARAAVEAAGLAVGRQGDAYEL
jgi:pyrroloquinoline quinone biosynthesis protein B